MSPHLPEAGQLAAERNRQLAAKQPDAAIAAAQELVDGIARSSTAKPAERSRAEEFLAETLEQAKRYELAFGWALHAAGTAAEITPIVPPAQLATDKGAAAALIASMPLTKATTGRSSSFIVPH